MTLPQRYRVAVTVAGGLLALAVATVSLAVVVSGTGGRRHGATGVFTPLPPLSTAPGSPSGAPSPVPSPSPSALPPATMPGTGGRPVGWWRPTGTLTWQWQLTGKLDLGVPADVYDIDGVESTPAQVAALHKAGRKAICYVNAGAYENFRPDHGRFPAAVLGKGLDGWPGEKWLDVRRWDVLAPIMRDRFGACRAKGFDGIEADNVDGYSNRTGFPLTADDQLTYNRRLADLAHGAGLAIGLKNDVEQASSLAPWFDYSIDEQCAQYDECDKLTVFTAAGKPVFHVEYGLAANRFCTESQQLGFSSMRKKEDLDAWRQPC